MSDLGGRDLRAVVIAALSIELKKATEVVRSAKSLKSDLGMDSIGAVNVAFALEEELGIEIELVRGEPFDSVEDIVEIVSRCLAASSR